MSSPDASTAAPRNPSTSAAVNKELRPVDPPPSADAIWNWRAAISAGRDRLAALAGPNQDLSDASGLTPLIPDPAHPGTFIRSKEPHAYPFWIRQVKQWALYNQKPANPGVPVAPPPDQIEGGNGIFCNFTLSPVGSLAAPVPPYTTPAVGSANTFWVADAILIKQYGGVASTTKNANYLCGITPEARLWLPRGHFSKKTA